MDIVLAKRLTVTNVVFELVESSWNLKKVQGLTVTNVVFELKELKDMGKTDK